MKRIILALTMVLSILFQPCLAAGKQEKIDLSTYKKPDVELKHYDVCLYTLAPDELRFNIRCLTAKPERCRRTHSLKSMCQEITLNQMSAGQM